MCKIFHEFNFCGCCLPTKIIPQWQFLHLRYVLEFVMPAHGNSATVVSFSLCPAVLWHTQWQPCFCATYSSWVISVGTRSQLPWCHGCVSVADPPDPTCWGHTGLCIPCVYAMLCTCIVCVYVCVHGERWIVVCYVCASEVFHISVSSLYVSVLMFLLGLGFSYWSRGNWNRLWNAEGMLMKH